MNAINYVMGVIDMGDVEKVWHGYWNPEGNPTKRERRAAQFAEMLADHDEQIKAEARAEVIDWIEARPATNASVRAAREHFGLVAGTGEQP